MMPAPPPEAAEAANGRIAGRYEIVRSLGDGAFAVVYEAIDHELSRRVALKLFSGYDEAELEAALREARAMARINHEHVLLVHDIGKHRGIPFLALEYADTDLHRWLGAAKRDPDDILHVYREAGLGLAAAHQAGLVHHDFKPANVMLRADGSAAVGDFGLARHLDSQDEESPLASEIGDNYAFGTLLYIAPERLLGRCGGARSDQFSYCVALWEALAGEHPFVGADAQRRYDSIAAGPSGSPSAPALIVRALRRGLALEADDRFETMDELLAAFDMPVVARPRITRGLRPGLSVAALAIALAIGLTASREAPALDFELTPPIVLTASAAINHAQELVHGGQHTQAVAVLTDAMPIVRQTDRAHQLEYLEQLEALGDALFESGAYQQSAYTFAAGRSLARSLGVGHERLTDKRTRAQTLRNRSLRDATRDK